MATTTTTTASDLIGSIQYDIINGYEKFDLMVAPSERLFSFITGTDCKDIRLVSNKEVYITSDKIAITFEEFVKQCNIKLYPVQFKSTNFSVKVVEKAFKTKVLIDNLA